VPGQTTHLSNDLAGDLAPIRQLASRWLGAAPHRLLFFVGACNVLLAMLFWAGWLVLQRWPIATPAMPAIPPGWLHAFVMQYQVLPSFMFGFLLTVFPRWLALPELARWRYLPVGLGLLGGQLLTLLGALGGSGAFGSTALNIGLVLTLFGWAAGLYNLAPMLWQERGSTWHARACFAALIYGFVGLCAHAAFAFGGSAMWEFVSIKIGTFGLLLPMYFSVAHRMFPFFAANVCPGYTPWRPMWLLAAFWGLCVAHLALELVHGYAWLWLPDIALLLLTAAVLSRWWPRGPKPALLSVLFISFAWLPVAFALYGAQSLIFISTGAFTLSRAPAHALFIGFFGSALIAMVTRVTQGHSGRSLSLPGAAVFAFIAIQCVAILRILAALLPDAKLWQAIAAIAWIVAFTPWVVRLARIYLAPRLDGKPG
jgi:uncharacterized protein involved in response to NO